MLKKLSYLNVLSLLTIMWLLIDPKSFVSVIVWFFTS